MAGILNNKERVLDFLITKRGRDQISSGKMRVEYASLTDRHTFYEATGSHAPNVASDASNRIFFESSERPQDIIVPELESGFLMQPFRAGDLSISGRKIASGTFKTGAVTNVNVLSGTAVTDIPEKLMKSLVTNFAEQRILGTHDQFNDTTEFILAAHTGTFAMTDFSDYQDTEFNFDTFADLRNIANIYTSDRFQHLPNFKFLPPVNKLRPNQDAPTPLGSYPELIAERTGRFLTKNNLDDYLASKQVITLNFTETSTENNLIGQFFHFSENPAELEKLSVIDYGEFQDSDPNSPGTHVYFIGKIRTDDQGAQCFINLFTVVFD